MESCPGEKCTFFEKTCADGTCLVNTYVCRDKSDPCEHAERRCKDGKCYKTYRRCPEDPCDSHQPFRCGTTCLYNSQVCDRTNDCPNGEDEHGCPPEEEEPSYENIKRIPGFLWALLLLFIPSCLCLFCIVKCCNNKDKESNNNPDNNEGATRNLQNRNIQNRNIPPVNMSACDFASSILHANEGTALINPSAPPILPSNNMSGNTPSAPPAYEDVVKNQSFIQSPPQPPPAYPPIIWVAIVRQHPRLMGTLWTTKVFSNHLLNLLLTLQ